MATMKIRINGVKTTKHNNGGNHNLFCSLQKFSLLKRTGAK